MEENRNLKTSEYTLLSLKEATRIIISCANSDEIKKYFNYAPCAYSDHPSDCLDAMRYGMITAANMLSTLDTEGQNVIIVKKNEPKPRMTVGQFIKSFFNLNSNHAQFRVDNQVIDRSKEIPEDIKNKKVFKWCTEYVKIPHFDPYLSREFIEVKIFTEEEN